MIVLNGLVDDKGFLKYGRVVDKVGFLGNVMNMLGSKRLGMAVHRCLAFKKHGGGSREDQRSDNRRFSVD